MPQVIAQIQNDTGARVKMSQNNDFFPGTQDRVVLITGVPIRSLRRTPSEIASCLPSRHCEEVTVSLTT